MSRLPGVLRILYLVFTEGYLSSHAETAIRRELCDEAIRLTAVLIVGDAKTDPQARGVYSFREAGLL